MPERRLLYAVESVPPTSPPTYTYLQQLKDATDPTDGAEDFQLGCTMGDAFPATPQAYHRHYLTNGIISAAPEWFFWDPTRNAGAGRWVSERSWELFFTSGSALNTTPLNLPSIGASGNTLGYWCGGRPFVVFGSQGSQTAGGGDGGLRLRLRSSLSATEVAFITLGNNLTRNQGARDVVVPTLGADELFWCDSTGVSGTGVIARWFCRRTES